jgi:hypothetical protein
LLLLLKPTPKNFDDTLTGFRGATGGGGGSGGSGERQRAVFKLAKWIFDRGDGAS